MYSILIVDDESIILEGLSEVILASDLPFKEVKTAGSAKSALELFAKTPFDIILSDISMPEMDGLSMVEETRKIWPGTSVIFLTGYQDFEYARRAIKLGSVDYLLKPIMDEQLISVLRGLVDRLDTEWFNRFHAGGNRWEMDRTGLERLNSYFYDLLAGDASFCRQDSLSRAEIPLNAELKVRMLVIRYGGRVGEKIENRTHLWLMNILQKVVYGMGWITGFQYETNCSIFLLQPEAKREIDTVSLLKEVEEMQSYFYEQLDMSMSICLTEAFALTELKNVLEHVLSHREITNADGTLFLCQVDENPDQLEENGNYIVQRVERYIRENPGEDLSLSALSSRFRINPSYLSRIFHQTLGVQLSAFITEVRIEESKRLLRETDDKIYEISHKVGFETPGYFTKVFNRMVKMSPKEYRAVGERQQ
jgi:two-component system response regulator YesN